MLTNHNGVEVDNMVVMYVTFAGATYKEEKDQSLTEFQKKGIKNYLRSKRYEEVRDKVNEKADDNRVDKKTDNAT